MSLAVTLTGAIPSLNCVVWLLLSLLAVGPSFTAVTVIVSVAVSDLKSVGPFVVPLSVVVYVNMSVPLKFGSGVYVIDVPFVETEPWAADPVADTVSV